MAKKTARKSKSWDEKEAFYKEKLAQISTRKQIAQLRDSLKKKTK